MSTAPYSDQWRQHARARMQRYGLNVESVGRRTGLDKLAGEALLGHDPVDLEIAGPIDELLDALEDGTEVSRAARALVVPDHAPVVAPVAVDSLGALDGARVLINEHLYSQLGAHARLP